MRLRMFFIGAVVMCAPFSCFLPAYTTDGSGGGEDVSTGTRAATTSVGGASGSMSSSGSGGMTTSSSGDGGAGAATSSVGGNGGTGGDASSSGGGNAGSGGASAGGGGAGGSAPTCPMDGNLLFKHNSCYQYEVYDMNGNFSQPSDPDAACVKTDCSLNVNLTDLVVYWGQTNVLEFTGPVTSVECKCSVYSVPPQKASVVVELNTAPAPTTVADSGSGLDHKYVVSACSAAISCMIQE